MPEGAAHLLWAEREAGRQAGLVRLPTLAPVALSPQDTPTVVVEDLRLCTVKPCEDIERRFCFEVVSPTK